MVGARKRCEEYVRLFVGHNTRELAPQLQTLAKLLEQGPTKFEPRIGVEGAVDAATLVEVLWELRSAGWTTSTITVTGEDKEQGWSLRLPVDLRRAEMERLPKGDPFARYRDFGDAQPNK